MYLQRLVVTWLVPCETAAVLVQVALFMLGLFLVESLWSSSALGRFLKGVVTSCWGFQSKFCAHWKSEGWIWGPCAWIHMFWGVPELHRTVLQYMLFAPSTTLFCVHFCQPMPLLVVDFQVWSLLVAVMSFFKDLFLQCLLAGSPVNSVN